MGKTMLRQLTQGIAPTSDSELLQRFIASQDEAAFATLVERHGAMVLGVARRILGNEHAAEDVFQATFLVLARKASAIGRRELLANWLYGVAHRLSLQARSRAAARHRREEKADPRQPADTVTEVALREMCEVLDEELHRLSEPLRAAFLLCYVEGKTRDQAARLLGWSLRTLQRRLEQGKELLRGRLMRRGITLSAALLVIGNPALHAAVPNILLTSTLQGVRPAALSTLSAGQGISTEAAALADIVATGMTATKTPFWTALAVALVLAAPVLGLLLKSFNPGLPDKPTLAPPPAQKPMRADGPLEPRHRLGNARLRHGGHINAVAFSPDGTLVASAGNDWQVRVWDAATGNEVFRRQLRGWATALAFSVDGAWLVAGSGQGQLHVWDIAAGRQLRLIDGHKGAVRQLAISRDGKWVFSAGADGSVAKWDAASGAAIFKADVPGLTAMALSADNAHLVVGDRDGWYQFLDPDTGEAANRSRLHEGHVHRLAFSPSGGMLASTADDRTVQLGELARVGETVIVKLLRRIDLPEIAHALAFSSDGHRLVTGAERHLQIWDVATGQEQFRLHGHAGTIRSTAFSTDDRFLVTGGTDNRVRVWDLAQRKECHVTPGHQALVVALAMDPAAKTLVSASTDGTLRFWDTATHQESKQVDIAPDAWHAVAIAPRGDILAAASSAKAIRVWELTTGLEQAPLEGADEGNKSLAFSPDGKLLAAAGADGSLRVWELAERKLLWQTSRARALFLPVAFSPDGKTLAAGGSNDKDITLFDPLTGSPIERLPVHKGIHVLAFAPDGTTLVSSGHDGIVLIWDTATWKVRRSVGPYQLGSFGFTALAVTPDSRRLAVASPDRMFRIFDLTSAEQLALFGGHVGWVRALLVTPDGRQLISASEDTTILFWDFPRPLSQD